MTQSSLTRMYAGTVRPDLIARWLFAVAAMVLLMVVVGGVTRLTESGLSMTEWNPIFGVVPPMNAMQWQSEYFHYQLSPQYRLMNLGMTLTAFKQIYFWEYLHRVIARVLVGVIFPVPLLYFIVRRAVPRQIIGKLVAIFILFPMQGAVGWLMVASGLVDNRVNVQPVMLAAHLTMALLLLAVLIWTALDCLALAKDSSVRLARLIPFAAVVISLLGLQIIYGALTAGLRAGVVANSWPLMNDHFFPRGIHWQGARTLIADPYLVHFIHRWWAFGAFIGLMLLARRVKPLLRPAATAIHVTVGAQILLGITTVMSGIYLPLAAMHQLTGALVLASTIWAAHILGRKASLHQLKLV